MGIDLGVLDRVTPLAHTPAFDGMTVRVTKVRAELKKRTVTIQPELRYQPTTDLAPGEKQTVQRGKPGVIEITERVWSKDGKVTAREYVSRKVVSPTRHKIVGLGSRSRYMPGRMPYHRRYARAYAFASRGSSLSARSGSPRDRYASVLSSAPVPGTFRAVRSLTLIATGYSPDPSENGGYTVTATGLPIGYGAAAVDPRVIPLGTKLYVEGYGYAFACDVGGAIKGKRIDLAYNSYYVANTKGHKKVRVWILAP
jgi:3D (Asp-Asp-Asp) domain-containing protein